MLGWTPGNGWLIYANFVGAGASAMAVSGGDVYVGGNFQGLYDWAGHFVPAYNVAKLHVATGAWTPIGGGTATDVYSITVDSNQGIYVSLTTAATAVPSTGYPGMLAKWNPSSQSWEAVGGGLHVAETNNLCGFQSQPRSATIGRITALTAVGTDIYICRWSL